MLRECLWVSLADELGMWSCGYGYSLRNKRNLVLEKLKEERLSEDQEHDRFVAIP